tara:strand:- start:336 stop:1055 length:720 start_codon:yes stop_codon:yes gene_type:complete
MIWKDLVTKRRGEYSARLRLAHLINGNEFTFWPTPVAQDDNKSPEAHMRMKQRMKGGPRHKPTSLQVMVKGVERGLWPTPTAQDNNQVSGNPDHPKRGTTLGGAARLWPTPTASDSEGGPRQQDGRRGRALKDLPQQMWPTPTVRDHKDTGKNTNYEAIAKKKKLAGAVMFPTPAAHEAKLGYQDRNRGMKGTQESLTTKVINDLGGRQVTSGQLNPTWVEWLMGLPLGWTDLGSWETE